MIQRLPKGHSNVAAEETRPWPDLPMKARIPLVGGAHVFTVKSLPPLALSEEEWRTIGRAMGWLKNARRQS